MEFPVKGRDLVENPLFGKGTVFTEDRRAKYERYGLLPPLQESAG